MSFARALPPLRVYVVLHLFLSFIICNADRINLSVAIIPMGNSFGWSNTIRGFVQATFFVGYMSTQILAGILADKYSAKKCLVLAVAFWSLLTVLTPLAAKYSLVALYATRMLLGACEGFAMPSVNAMVSTWVPSGEIARALSFIYSGMYGGSILGLLVSPIILAYYDWAMLFYSFGLAGIAWCVVFFLTTSDTPKSSNIISHAEKNHILQNAPASTGNYQILPSSDAGSSPDDGDNNNNIISNNGNAPPSLRDIFSRKCVWAIIVAHFCCTMGYFIQLTWLPTFLHMKYKVDISGSSILATTPWITMFVFANVGGYIADTLIHRGVNRTTVRKLMQSIGFLGPSLFLGVFLPRAHTAAAAITYISAALALSAFSNSGVYSNHQDIGPKISGTLLGISNTFASLSGIIGVAITGYILDHTHNWNLVFGIAIAFYITGFAFYNAFATAQVQWD